MVPVVYGQNAAQEKWRTKMKKLLKISAVTLVAAVIFITAGIIWISKDNVNIGSVYALAQENLKIGESNFEYSPPERFDLSKVSSKSEIRSLGYELNEFNTIELYAENCAVEFIVTNGDLMSATVDDGDLTTAVTGGTLYVQATSQGEGELTIGMPDTYKGGFTVNTSECTVALGTLDSAMDMRFNLYKTALSADSLSADSITFMTSGSSVTIKDITATDGLTVSSDSTELKASNIAAKYTNLTLNNSTSELSVASGSLSCDSRMSDINASFDAVTGNISLDLTAGRANLKLPNQNDIVIRHDEDYGVFQDKTKSAQNSATKPAVHYTMETNIKYGIVTVTN